MKIKLGKVHKEGKKLILGLLLAAVVLCLLDVFVVKEAKIATACYVVALLLVIAALILRFFYRYPSRAINEDVDAVFSPADGKIVACEMIYDDVFTKEKVWQVSIFMNVYNVHVNFAPVSGKITYKNHTDGKNYPAINPKSSNLNEQCITIIEPPSGKRIVVNQIAGIAARRIVNKLQVGDSVEQGGELGIIKFGSRVDMYLPLSCKINVSIGQRVKAKQTIIAILQN